MAQCSVDGCDRTVFAAGMCSRHYMRRLRTGTTDDGPRGRADLATRFWRQVDKRSPGSCWPWVGRSKIDGYGVIGVGGRSAGKMLSHRVAWMLANGEIPTSAEYHGTVVRHTCDNRLCCNPAHLEIGSQADNVRDMDCRGRRLNKPHPGSSHPNAKLTEDDVRAIRASSETNSVLAARYGIDRHHIAGIRKRRSWTHI